MSKIRIGSSHTAGNIGKFLPSFCFKVVLQPLCGRTIYYIFTGRLKKCNVVTLISAKHTSKSFTWANLVPNHLVQGSAY